MPILQTIFTMDWLALLLSLGLVTGYEMHFQSRSRRYPLHYARTAHARLRTRWVHELMQKPGLELLAIQTIRNSVMSATVTASTAVLALMGGVTMLSNRLGAEGLHAITLGPKAVAAALLMVILFATFVLSAMAVRFFNHAGYLMGSQAQGSARAAVSDLAARYMVRAGNYYSQGMRTLLWLMPPALGLISLWLMPPAVLLLIVVMTWFDRSPEPLDEHLVTDSEVK
jgi:uncharacterized membrane protein